MNVMRQTACLVVNPITVNNLAELVGRASADRGSTVGHLLLKRFRVGLLLSTRLVSSQ